MAFTGKLGTSDSKPKSVILAFGASAALEVAAGVTIEFVDAAYAFPDVTLGVTIAFADGASCVRSSSVVAGDELEFTDVADRSIRLTVGNTIAFTDGSESTFEPRVLFVDAGNTLEFVDGATSPTRSASAGSEFQETIQVYNPDTLSFDTVITGGLSDGAEATIISAKLVGNALSFSHGATRIVVHPGGIEVESEDTLDFEDGAVVNIVLEAGNTQTFTDGASGEASRPAGVSITFVDQASVEVVRSLEASNELNLTHGVAYTLIQACTEKLYSPFVGGSPDGAPDPPPTTLPSYGTDGFRLQYPATGSVTDELILRNPNLGNGHRITKSRILRESRGGTLIVYSDPIWPKFDSLVVTISGLKNDDKTDLLTFMEMHLGENIRLIDWENREWTGVIVPSDPIVEDRPGSFTAAFEFEGERVSA